MAMRHWLIGCGLGCGAILLIVVALGFTGVLFVRDTMKGFETAIESRNVLDERFGEPGEFVPPPDGVIPPERIEAFLAVRGTTQSQRDEIARVFAGFPMSEKEGRELESKPFMEKMRAVLGIAGSAMGLGEDLGSFFEARNQALLDQNIGMGEYTYLYVVAYYSWLGHDPEDGPEDIHVESERQGVVTRRGHERGLGSLSSSRVRDDLVSMMRNQLESLPGDADEDWRRLLAAEVEAMESDRGRVPWKGGLPDAIAVSLEPFRERLEATYSPATNEFELARNRKQGSFSIRAD